MNLKDKTICIYDHGTFVDWAIRMAEFFGRTLYYCPYKSAFPRSRLYAVGEGLPGVERIDDFFKYKREVDVFMFPDVNDGDLQVDLREQGYAVWGSADAEELETNRWETKQLTKRLGLPVQHVERIVGMTALKKHLQNVKDKWIKSSRLRGDFETFHMGTYELTEPRFIEIEHELGGRKETKEFIVEDAINDCVEAGYDGFTVDGKFPRLPMMGYEIKDTGYIGLIVPYNQFPPKIKLVNDKLSDIFRQYKYRGFWSSEIRLRNKEPYLIDPCCRSATPPSEIYQEMYDNWGEVVWGAAHGDLVEPHPIAKYGVEAIIHNEWGNENWAPLYYPREIARWVKLRNHCIYDGVDYVAPQEIGLPEIGGVIAIDDTLVGAVKKVVEYSKQLKGYGSKVILESMSDAIKTINEGIKCGIPFGDDPIPSIGEVEELVNA